MRHRFDRSLAVALLLGTLAFAAEAGDPLSDGFRAPPREARAHTWWHWMNGNVSKTGITADLEAMARVGLGGVQLFDAGLALPAGPVAFDTPAWYEHVAFAAREAERLGLSFGIANCSGWTSSGGPWITPALSMKVVTSSRLETRGPRWLETRLEAPKDTHGFYADIAVVAFPTPVSRAEIPDFAHQVFRLRGDERGPVGVDPIPDDAILANACVDPGRLVDVTTNLAADGTFRWEVPSGDWTVLRVGYRANGQRNRPATAHGSGLECDKLSARALDVHFDAYVGKVAAALKGSRSFDNVLIDSYEVKGQNWTDGFEREFRARAGYDITSYLPVLANVPVGSAAETRRFLADFRRVISALFCENYAGRMAERCHALGVKFACEPYGNGPFNDLAYGERCDIPMAEFWTLRGDGVSMWTRWGHRWRGNARVVASTAHYWGKPIVGAEAFTAYPTATSGRWLEHPASMKAQGDMILADGVNRFYFHRYAHQPWTSPDRFPGMTMAFYGSHLERTQTWWENGFKAYLAYLSRAQYLLSRGTFVADALITVGDEAPNFGTDGETPEGWRSDHCTAAALAKLRREGAAFVSPGGVRYRVVAKPGDDIGAKLAAAGCPKDFVCADRNVSWIHRRDGEDEIYFVATAATAPTRVRCSFRDAAGEPELWNPETGEIEKATCRRADGREELDLAFGPADSVFVVFRRQPTASARPVRQSASSPTCVRTLDGPWRVSFAAPGSKTPFERRFATLADWSKSEDEEVRYFSGTATYEMTVTLAERPRDVRRVLLDLGDVKDIAEVFVDGRPVRTLWKPPFVVDVTEAAGARPFRLSVKVTNRWPNRLIGDERQHRAVGTWNADNKWKRPVIGDLPAWLTTGGVNPSGASTFATCRLWRADDELLPSGLVGPVRILFEPLLKSRETGEGERP